MMVPLSFVYVLISIPGPSAQVNDCDHVCPALEDVLFLPPWDLDLYCAVLKLYRAPLRWLICQILDFSSATTEMNLTKNDRMQVLNVLCQVCVFPEIRKPIWLPCYVAVCNNYAICNKLQTALNCNAVCNTLQTAFRVLKIRIKRSMK